jgi:hypothetical protein
MTLYAVHVEATLEMWVEAEDENEAKELATPMWTQEPTGDDRKRIKGVCWGPEDIQVVEVLQPHG